MILAEGRHQDSAEEVLLESLRWRYAVKSFQRGGEIPELTWSALEESLVLTPSSYGLQPWKFIVIKDPAIKKALRVHSLNQTQVEDCSHLVVFLARQTMTTEWIDRHLKRTAELRDIPIENLNPLRKSVVGDFEGFLKDHVAAWATHQCFIALGSFLTAAASLNVDTCAIGGFYPEKYNEILGVNRAEWSAVVVCAVGYRSLDDERADRPKVRFAIEDVIERR